ncbi:MAG TPA: glycosyltransferase family 4 protein [Thermoleophilaceae bacterium]
MRVLFANHTGARSGAENAMLRLLESLPDEHELAVACPPAGPLKAVLRSRGVRQYDLSGTEVSLTLHPVRTPRGLLSLLRSAFTLRGLARRFRADVIHANSVRAGLIAVLARRLGGPPVVVQCHDHLPDSRVGNLTRAVIAREAEVVVAVTDTTAAHFNHGLARPKAERVYISLDHGRFSPEVRGSSAIRSELALQDGAPLLTQVSQITPWKGQDTAIRALPGIRERFDAHLLLVGDVSFSSQRFDNVGYRRKLERLARELGVEPAVHFLGQRPDVAELMGASDLLLLPSWDEPFGLVVAEAMAIGVPVMVTNRGGVSEYVTDGVHGRLLPPHDPAAWAAAAVALLGDPEAMARMREENVKAAGRFTDEAYSSNMVRAYERAAAA